MSRLEHISNVLIEQRNMAFDMVAQATAECRILHAENEALKKRVAELEAPKDVSPERGAGEPREPYRMNVV